MSNKPTPKVRKPILAIALERNVAGWSVVKMRIQGDKIVERSASEPDLRAFALERLLRDMYEFWDEDGE